MRGGVQGRRQSDSGDEINLGTVARALWRNKRAIIGPTLLMAAAAFVGVNLITPRFKSEARVLVEGRENIFLRPEAEKALMDRGTVDAETVTSQVQLILSRDLAREVIKDLNRSHQPFILRGTGKVIVETTVRSRRQRLSLIERWRKSLNGECIRPGTPLSLEDARRLVNGYVDHFNKARLNSATGYITPKEMLAGRQQEIHAARDRELEEARKQRQVRRQKAA